MESKKILKNLSITSSAYVLKSAIQKLTVLPQKKHFNTASYVIAFAVSIFVCYQISTSISSSFSRQHYSQNNHLQYAQAPAPAAKTDAATPAATPVAVPPAADAKTDTPVADAAPAAPTAPVAPPVPVQIIPKFKKFRLGKILNAELSTKKVAISGLDKFFTPQQLQKKDTKKKADDGALSLEVEKKYAFAVVTVELNEKRTLSIYDYVLTDESTDFPCYAISINDEPFDFKKWELKKFGFGDKVKMLFEVEVSSYDVPKIEYSLKNKVLPNKEDNIILPFKNLGDKDFTSAKKVPFEGMLAVDQPAPPAPPTPDPAQATPAAVDAAPKTDALPADIGPVQAAPK